MCAGAPKAYLHQFVDAELESACAYSAGRMAKDFGLPDTFAIAHYRPWLLAILLSLIPNRASLCYL
jgi:hypothetical protein